MTEQTRRDENTTHSEDRISSVNTGRPQSLVMNTRLTSCTGSSDRIQIG